jgi:hypothetical protein
MRFRLILSCVLRRLHDSWRKSDLFRKVKWEIWDLIKSLFFLRSICRCLTTIWTLSSDFDCCFSVPVLLWCIEDLQWFPRVCFGLYFELGQKSSKLVRLLLGFLRLSIVPRSMRRPTGRRARLFTSASRSWAAFRVLVCGLRKKARILLWRKRFWLCQCCPLFVNYMFIIKEHKA